MPRICRPQSWVMLSATIDGSYVVKERVGFMLVHMFKKNSVDRLLVAAVFLQFFFVAYNVLNEFDNTLELIKYYLYYLF